MYEVELKARIENPHKIRKRIKEIAKFKGKKIKIDDYYCIDNNHKKNLRIRKQGNSYIVTHKKRGSYKQGINVKKEIEFDIEDIASFKKVLESFGFKKWISKHKTSEVYELKKNIHVELNLVRGLGWFVEIEILADKDIAKARDKIKEIFKNLGIRNSAIEKKGYTQLLWDRTH